jgi:tetratricopeptide (TPR) repeat protein
MNAAFERELLAPERVSERLEFHRRLVAEQEAAAAICDRVLTGPPAWWANAVKAEEGACTAGMVATLIERSEAALRRSTHDALVLSEIALGIANLIETNDYLYDHVQKLRGQALRQQAFVLSSRGELKPAARTAGLSRLLLRQIPIPDLELARLDLVDSDVARRGEKYDDAIASARRGGQTFLDFGQRTSWLKARNYEAAAFYSAGNPASALDIWRAMERYSDLLTAEFQAVRLHNMGICARATGRFEEAVRCYARAATEFDRLGLTVNRIKCGYSIGLALSSIGRHDEAIVVLGKAADEMDAVGLDEDAALAKLARVEALLALGRAGDVPSICRDLVERFTRAGIHGAAMTAIAFLRETVATGHATPASVRGIRDFVSDTTFRGARALVAYRESSLSLSGMPFRMDS